MAEKPTWREEVTADIVRAVEAGTAPWQRPWDPGKVADAPHNPTNGRAYRGGNAIVLACRPYRDPRWMTYRQASQAGAQVRRGERGTVVEFWRWTDREKVGEKDGKPVWEERPRARPQVFYAHVFNAEQIDGLDEYRAPEPAFEPVARAEELIAGGGVAIKDDRSGRAYYAPLRDEINMPPRSQFKNAAGYYATALHELGHATGHESRLRRRFGAFGSETYAREELRAEIASYMTARQVGVGHDPAPHASYVANWLKALRDDPHEIFRAARDAETINVWITEPERRPELERQAQERGQAQARAREAGEDRSMSTESPRRHYLAVPYEEKNKAKAAGARWDRAAKAWYAPDGTDLAPLKAWDSLAGKAPENTAAPPQTEFAQACRNHGLIVRDVEMDGQWRRVAVKGDRGKDTSGSYRGYLDGRPNGQITNFREGGTVKWVATGSALTPENREALRTEAQDKRTEREADRERAHAAAAKKAFGVWENAPPAKAEAAYLQSRAVGAHGLRTADRDRLIVPVRDAGGALMSLQFISPDGKKRLMAGGRKDGGMHVIEARGGRGDGPIIVAEGYATAATLGEASGHTAVCAFDAGNLRAVAEALRTKHPQRAIVMAADDDRAKRGRGNVGLNRARDAARAVGGKVVEPGFSDAERAKGMTDFNDLARARGVEAVRAALAPALAGARKRAAPARAAEDERGLAMAG